MLTDRLYPGSRAIAPVQAEDEYLHRGESEGPELSETSFFGFNIPEAAIDCEIYHWFHPNLRMMSGGLMIFRGKKAYAAQADYLDYRNFMPWPQGDIDDVTYPTGVRIKVLKPLARFEISFRSPDGDTAFDFVSTAIMPPAGRGDGHHFVQAMHCEGELVLNGKRHCIDGFTTRDRSYGLLRSEAPHDAPPLAWGAAVFDRDLAFHFVGVDSEDLTAESIRWGYVWRDGRLWDIVRMRKNTERGGDGARPTGATIELEDGGGCRHLLTARALARLPMPFWPNMVTQLTLMEYRLPDGRTGHGDYQDVLFGHFLRTLNGAED